MVRCAGSLICVAHADMTFTRSKVMVKVTGLLNVQKLHFSKSIFSASLPHSSKLVVDYGGMGPSLQHVGARFLNFLLSSYQVISNFCNVDIIGLSKGRIFLLLDATVTRASTLVVLYVLCMLMWPWPDPKSRSRGDNCQLPSAAIFSWLYCSIFCIGHISVLLYYHTHKCCWSAAHGLLDNL